MMILRTTENEESRMCAQLPISNQEEFVVKGLLIRNEYELRTCVSFTH